MTNKNILSNIYNNLDEEKKPYAEKMINELDFMEKTLKKLRVKIRKEGAITEGINGNGFKVSGENPATKTYNNMIKNYNSTIKLLMDLIPDEEGKDELEEWRAK
jgi:hypothetical protein